MNLHLESMLEDITDILDVSNEKEEAKKKIQRKFGKAGIPKGRLEKAKHGIGQVVQKSKKKVINKMKIKTAKKKKNKKKIK